jgi:hypothetical protein
VRGSYFVDRWNGQVPWRRLLWPEMLGVGTFVNLLATLLALVAAIERAPLAVVALLHFAPLPYNAFLLAALWRAPERPAVVAGIGAAWFVAVLFV